MNCKYCSKECKNDNSLRNHERLCKLNPDRKEDELKGYVRPWTEERRKQHSLIMKERSKTSNRHIWSKEERQEASRKSKLCNQKYWTEERRRQQSETMKKIVERSPGSYSANNVCGRTKKYEMIDYLGSRVMLNGKWEVEVANWLNRQNIKWTNIIKEGFKYIWENSEHLYFPDFYLPEYDLYLEVKGYERERDHCKWKVVKNLVVLKEKEIELIKKQHVVVERFLRLSHKQ